MIFEYDTTIVLHVQNHYHQKISLFYFSLLIIYEIFKIIQYFYLLTYIQHFQINPYKPKTKIISSMRNQYPSNFLATMQELGQLKQQLLKIYYTFSPKVINYHQLKIVANLKEQVEDSVGQLKHIQTALKQNNKEKDTQINAIAKQKRELQEVNLQLVECNDKLVNQLQATNEKLQKVAIELEQERQHRKQIQIKHNKEIQNIKLLHTQELYILKKKDKRQNN